MPHECVSCGEVFEDGADEVFDGCPDCGATKFFYVKEVTPEEANEEPDGRRDTSAHAVGSDVGVDVDADPEPRTEPDTDPDSIGEKPDTPAARAGTETPDPTDIPTQTAGAGDTDRDTATNTETETNTNTETDDDIVEADSEYEDSFGGNLDSEKEREPDTGEHNPDSVTTDSEGRRFRRARPDEARQRLLDEFETIRIVEPGSYELNLMNLYEDEGKIIALQEDGKYQVSLPSTIDDD
jgi:predicted  nucleic acid-binding Zn-ribbon protein